jgi:RNA polymerase sigma-70 factor (ECF subfamily)
MTIARNRIIDRLRDRTQREQKIAVEHIESLLAESPDHAVSVEEEAWLRQRGDAVLRALAELPEEQRRAILLAYFGGLSQSMIAEQLGWPLGTVKKRIQLGLRKLRASLDNLKSDEQARAEEQA